MSFGQEFFEEKRMKLMDAAEEVLKDIPNTRDNKYLWLYLVETLRKMGFNISVQFHPKMPSPDAMLTERRTILNKKNKFAEDFIPEEGVIYEKPEGVLNEAR